MPLSRSSIFGPSTTNIRKRTSVSHSVFEPLAEELEISAELAKVIELAVVGDPPAVGIGHRLRASRRRIDDREPPVSQARREVALKNLDS